MFNRLKSIKTRTEGASEVSDALKTSPDESLNEMPNTKSTDNSDNIQPNTSEHSAPPTASSVIQAANMWDLVASNTDESVADTTNNDLTDNIISSITDATPPPKTAQEQNSIPTAVDTVLDEPVIAAEQVAEIAAATTETTSEPRNAPAEIVPPETKPVRRAGRVKTRLIGFDRSNGDMENVVADLSQPTEQIKTPTAPNFPVGWLVIVKGPGRGVSIALNSGVSQIGREEDQAIQLDFGDSSISRNNHASVAFDSEQKSFFIGHGGKSNLVRLNEKPLLSTEKLMHGDEIRIGETTLRLVALCDEHFTWGQNSEGSQ